MRRRCRPTTPQEAPRGASPRPAQLCSCVPRSREATTAPPRSSSPPRRLPSAPSCLWWQSSAEQPCGVLRLERWPPHPCAGCLRLAEPPPPSSQPPPRRPPLPLRREPILPRGVRRWARAHRALRSSARRRPRWRSPLREAVAAAQARRRRQRARLPRPGPRSPGERGERGSRRSRAHARRLPGRVARRAPCHAQAAPISRPPSLGWPPEPPPRRTADAML
mmetsp:Transcript_8449/g.27718  ORF Transcript_8449/g.27718 Transcript_8449/m.27718 type:complete len:221 (+) Transcript_8449:520-1182(+)